MATAAVGKRRTERKRKGPLRWLIPAGVAVVAFFLARWAFAMPKRAKGDPDTAEDAGQKGKGESGSPKPAPGGVTSGRGRPGVSYVVPEGWDPVRGLWISPDCEYVVEGPGWYFGLCLGPEGYRVCDLNYRDGWPWSTDGGSLTGNGQTMAEHLGSAEDAGALGFVANRLAEGLQPEDVARLILEEYAPMCADVDPSMWSPALSSWYQSLVARIVEESESELGGGFVPEAP